MKRRLWIGLIGALLATGVWWVRTREQAPATVAAVAARPAFVQVAGTGEAGADRVLREKADYFDPTPLFFPTEWNYGQAPLHDTLRRGLGQVFGSYPEKWTSAEQTIQSTLAPEVETPDQAADVLSAGNQTPFDGLGQGGAQVVNLAERSAFLEIRALGQGDYFSAQALKQLVLPRADFGPLEYLAVVAPEGLVGDLRLISGSGSEEVDAFFRAYLVDTHRIGGRLPPGRYQVRVGP
jgi:hypothetical protein